MTKADDDPPKLPFWAWLVWPAAGLLILSTVLVQPGPGTDTVPYSEFKRSIADGEIGTVTLGPTEALGAPAAGGGRRLRAILPPTGDPGLLPLLEGAGVVVKARAPANQGWLAALLPWIVILGVYLWISRRMLANSPVGPRGMGELFSGRFTKPVPKNTDVTFADVAGQEAAKQEVTELVEFLRDFQRFEKVGAEVPHGVLLMGPPGTGKTLLARALAGEAGVPFFSTSGSEFIEVFVGVGAGRVRRMFEAAREAAPAVVFIDELDSIGRTRGTGLGGGHDEREQTLNQILAELDGFSGREAVVVLAATNRPDVLDPALLRPGRFDRHVTLNLPDRSARRAILDVHAKERPFDADADLDALAAGTPGFSGADLKNLLNEAAIRAARRSAARITMADLDEARDRIMMGTVRTLAIRPEEKHRLAVHEAGHTAAGFYLPGADPVYKVTIIPRGQALGGTHMLPEEERHTLDERYLRDQLVTLLAGRAAERLYLGTVSSGADDDIRRATELARNMIARWGMSDSIGPVDLRAAEDHPFLGQSIAKPRSFADATAAQVDNDVMALLAEAERTADTLLADKKPQIDTLIARLETEETLDRAAIEACLSPDTKIAQLPTTRPVRHAPPEPDTSA